MLRSFHYAARYALTSGPRRSWRDLEPLAEAWEAHNRQAFLDGYRDSRRDRRPACPGPESRAAVLIAFELDKALYELDYERAHRPDWVPSPAGCHRTAAGGSIRGPE